MWFVLMGIIHNYHEPEYSELLSRCNPPLVFILVFAYFVATFPDGGPAVGATCGFLG